MTTGILCPDCGQALSRVLDSRPYDDRVRRRRQCSRGHRHTTHEVIVDTTGTTKMGFTSFQVALCARIDEVMEGAE